MILLQLNPILIAAAVLPAIALMYLVYRQDRLEREPRPLLWMLILQGIFSTAVAGFLERMGARLLTFAFPQTSKIYDLLYYFLVVGLAEEGCKYLFLKWRTWNNPNFNCRFDGIVYAVFVSLGFALWENLYYVVMFGFDGAVIRALTAIPGHAAFGVFMGAWYGQAKQLDVSFKVEQSLRCRRLAVLVPMLLHGSYDYIASGDYGALSAGFLAFIVCMFLAAYLTMRKQSRQDRYL